jgi:hypothetical protein
VCGSAVTGSAEAGFAALNGCDPNDEEVVALDADLDRRTAEVGATLRVSATLRRAVDEQGAACLRRLSPAGGRSA